MTDTEAIGRALTQVAEERGVRVLHAIESGSRAWGFASPDSDYDVRFLYVHPVDWYLRVVPGKDSIERMLPGDLDLVGWDLRKALALFGKGNCSLFEHLNSDIEYLDTGLGPELRALIPTYFNPIGAGYHYLGLANKIWGTYFGGGGGTAPGSIKKLFYVLRPVFAIRWIEEHDSMPPTSFHATLDGVSLSADDRARIDGWLVAKKDAAEADPVQLDAASVDWLRRALEHAAGSVGSFRHRGSVDLAPLDVVLKRAVLR